MNYAREKKLAAFKRNISRQSSVMAQYEAMQKALEEVRPAALRHQSEPGSL